MMNRNVDSNLKKNCFVDYQQKSMPIIMCIVYIIAFV